jgi:hypothetical protein
MRRLFAFLPLMTALVAVVAVAVAETSAADKLTALIVREETKNVKKSTGIYAYNCYTDDDLARFRESGRVRKIVEGLKSDAQFKAAVAAVAELSESARAEVLAKARKIAQPTYAMTGYIDPSGKSQTEAGRTAQLEIAAAICDAVQAAIAGGR